jgi:hypothetical protein
LAVGKVLKMQFIAAQAASPEAEVTENAVVG